jgi:hypothetical protein
VIKITSFIAIPGLTQIYLTLWSEKRQKKMNSTLVSSFVNKKLREVRYQEYIPLVKEFLEEATQPGWIEKFSAASPETTDLIERFKSTVELYSKRLKRKSFKKLHFAVLFSEQISVPQIS